jgi:hypothetical protein
VAGVIPTCLALILCDDVARDPVKATADLLGAFWTMEAAQLPSANRSFTIWVELTNGNGRVDMALQLAHLKPDRLEDEVLVNVPFSVNFTDPRAVQVYLSRVHDLQLEEPGDYRVMLTANGRVLLQRYFVVNRSEPAG